VNRVVPENSTPPDASVRSRRSDRWIAVGVAVWLVLISLAMVKLWSYKNTPGAMGVTPSSWPTASHIGRDPRRPIALMFVHPRCACTRASLAEMRELMSRANGRATACVVLALPAGVDAKWQGSEVWRTAHSIPGVTVVADPSELEARCFGARTSGHVVIYGPDGALRFSGGITAARGHVGENDGVDRALAAIGSPGRVASGSPVFGCALDERAR
jgi:hypothetical protein